MFHASVTMMICVHTYTGDRSDNIKQAKMENAASRLDSPTHNVHYKKARAID